MPRLSFGVCALVALVAFASSLLAADRQLVTLRSGFSLEADRVAADGDSLVLHLAEGSIVVARTDVESIDVLPVAPALEEPSTGAVDVTPAPEPPPVRMLVRDAAARHGLPEAFVASVAEAESALQPDAVSPKGARGVMQLMPETARILGVNPDDPAENIDGGAKLLRELLLRYQNHPDQVRRALAAYNAGAGAVQKYDGVPPYRETTAYVERVLRRYHAKAGAGPGTSTGSQQGQTGASQ